MTGLTRVLLLAFVLAASLVTQAQAQTVTDVMDRASLVGLDGVLVIVNEVPPELNRNGVSSDSLKTMIELRLRTVGIPVYSSVQDATKGPGSIGIAYVTTNAVVDPDSKRIAVTFRMELQRTMFLDLHGRQPIVASSWGVSDMYLLGHLALAQYLRQMTETLTDHLANDILAANPRTPPTPPSPPVSATPSPKRLGESAASSKSL